MTEKDIDSIAFLIRRAEELKKPKPIVFLGAGASISAGIPGTKKIVEDILTTFKDKPEVKNLPDAKRDYYNLMGCLTTDERHELLRGYITDEAVRINVSHIYLAQMLDEKKIDYVLTVNFDDLILRACALFNFLPPVYDIAILKDFTTTVLPEQSVTYLHGQHHGFWLLNTGDELQKVKESVRTVLERICNNRTWIVVGYSGEDTIFEHINNLGSFTNDLYWIGYQDKEPGDTAKELLERANSNAYWVKGYDADSFFLKLHSKLGMETPQIFNKPFSFLKGVITNIKDIETGAVIIEHKEDFEKVKERYDLTLTQINDAINKYEIGNTNIVLTDNDINKQLFKKEILDAIAKEEYKKADDLFNRADKNDIEIMNLIANLYFNWGVDSYEMAVKSGNHDLYYQATDKYRQSTSINSKYSKAYNNWGCVLADLAELTNNEALYHEAIEKYHLATKEDQKFSEALNNWGDALGNLARLKKDKKLFLSAIEKFRLATEINPKQAESFYNWGSALFNLAILTPDVNIYKEAAKKYQLATKANPQYSKAFNNWASVLIRIYKFTGEKRYLKQAQEKSKILLELGAGAYNLACCYALLKNKTYALKYLEQTLDKKEISIAHILKDDDWKEYWEDEDFKSLITKYS